MANAASAGSKADAIPEQSEKMTNSALAASQDAASRSGANLVPSAKMVGQQDAASTSKITGVNPEQTGTSLMNKAVGDKAASSQDVKKQIEGEPTAAQQAQGDC
jgi:hypothetical protein